MPAEAVVDFIGKDDKLTRTLDEIGGRVNKLESLFSKAFKVGIGLFSANHILKFGKSVLRAAADTEEFAERFDAVNKSVMNLKANIGSYLLPALESIVPVIDKIAAAFDKTSDSGGGWITRLQRNMAVLMGDVMNAFNKENQFLGIESGAAFDGGSDWTNPEGMKTKTKADYQAAAQKANAAAMRESNDAVARFRLRRRQMMEDQKGMQFEIADNPFSHAIKHFDVGKALGNALVKTSTWGADLGKALGDTAGGAIKESGVFKPDGKGFKSSVEGLDSLFNRIQGSAASTPEEKELQKVSTNTKQSATLLERVAKATEGMGEKMKEGLATLATYAP